MKEMYLRCFTESKNSIGCELADRLYQERLDWCKRNYRCLLSDTIGSFEENMSTNFRGDLTPRLDTKGSGRTVKDKEFIQTMW